MFCDFFIETAMQKYNVFLSAGFNEDYFSIFLYRNTEALFYRNQADIRQVQDAPWENGVAQAAVQHHLAGS